MKKDCWLEAAAISISARGALSIFENEGLDICAVLLNQEDRRLYTAFDEIGAALYMIRRNINEIILTPEQTKAA